MWMFSMKVYGATVIHSTINTFTMSQFFCIFEEKLSNEFSDTVRLILRWSMFEFRSVQFQH